MNNEWLDNQKQSISSIRRSLQERIEIANWYGPSSLDTF